MQVCIMGLATWAPAGLPPGLGEGACMGRCAGLSVRAVGFVQTRSKPAQTMA